MAAKRYWRIVGVSTLSGTTLELSELRLYEGGVFADADATLTASISPALGSLSDLRDDDPSSVVSWPYVKYAAPGFALMWDFGVGMGPSQVEVQMGSGGSVNTYPNALTVQSSSDGVSWTTGGAVFDLVYPGDNTIAPPVSELTDPYGDNVDLLLAFDAYPVVSSSPINTATLTLTSGAALTTSESRFGGSSLEISAVLGKLSVVTATAIDLTDTFTIEAWVRTTAAVTTDANTLIVTNDNVYPNRCVIDWYAPTSTTMVGRIAGASNSPIYTSPPQPYVLGDWAHIAYVNNVSDNTFKIFINGVLAGSRGSVSLFNSNTFQVGKNSSGWGEPPYQIDDLRITHGIARYTSSFDVPTTPASVPIPMSVPSTAIAQVDALLLITPADELPDSAAVGHMREHTFFDAYNGGVGNIIGTVKEKNTPANTPLHRRVLLVDEASRITIRETWSDPITGAFEFRGVKQGVKYSTISYDHLHNYRAVIADNQDAA